MIVIKMNKKILTTMVTALMLISCSASLTLADDIPTQADVDAYISVVFNYASAGWASIDISGGAVTDQAADYNNLAPYYNVSVDTNNEFKVEANSTDLIDGIYSIVKGNLKVDTDTNPASLSAGSAVAMTAVPQVIDTGIVYTTTTHYDGFFLSVDAGQHVGTYAGTVTLTYSSV
jgi:hypothetical protein